MKKKAGIGALVLGGLSLLSVSVHAAGGPAPHDVLACVVCGLCSLMGQVFG
jgi:hypothetical protein